MRTARQRNKIKMGPVIVLIGIALAAAFFGIEKLKESGKLGELAQSVGSSTNSTPSRSGNSSEPIDIVLSPFGGYAGGPYFNEGFRPNNNSRFRSEYGIDVNFVVESDQNRSLQMWINDEVDVHWFTVGAMSTIYDQIQQYNPIFFFQTDWSRGGDAIVARSGINTAADLRGKRIAFVPASPSHTAILGLLKANNMNISDITEVRVSDPQEAARMFNSGQVDAAAVWAPDDQTCVQAVPGSSVLMSTRQATHIIADCFFVKRATYEANPERFNNLAEGWIRGNGEINSDASNVSKAAGILATGFADGSTQDYMSAINNVRLASYGDNKNFFGLNPVFEGMTGSKLYTNIARMYNANNMMVGGSWQIVSTPLAVQAMTASRFGRSGDMAERTQTFEQRTAQQTENVASFATATVKVQFTSGSTTLSQAARELLDLRLAPTLEEFGSVQIRLEGHTDSQGDAAMNRSLSQARAQAIADYFINDYGMDANRFIVVGVGEDRPIASNATSEGRAQNRRVEAILLNN